MGTLSPPNHPMIITSKQVYAALAVAAIAFGAFFFSFQHAKADPGRVTCTTSTQGTVAIGNQASTQLLATSSARAWASIELVTSAAGVATSSVAIALNDV